MAEGVTLTPARRAQIKYHAKPEVKARVAERARKRRATPEGKKYQRDMNLRSAYGITLRDYDRMTEEQSGLCALCKDPGILVVDHDHLTGKVRELLCASCNSALGVFNDDPKQLRLAADYLERHRNAAAQ